MSYIIRTGNLAAAPELRHGDKGAYTYARVLVSDGIRQQDGTWKDGPTTGYDVAVNGADAVALVELAQRSGNVRITVAGAYSVSEWAGESGPRTQHRIFADTVAVSLRGQDVTVSRRQRADVDASPAAPEGEGGWPAVAEPPNGR